MRDLVLFVNGRRVEVSDEDLQYGMTLLIYLRNKLRLTGSKNACNQGVCGACSVILSKFDHHTQKLRHVTVNACITPLYYVHGCAITTVEGIGTARDGLHPLQKNLVQSHGIQCGFCTPGMVISLCCLLRNNPKPTQDDVERAIEGNLCRCTGYRSILDSMNAFVDCPMGEDCCKRDIKKSETEEVVSEYQTADPTQTAIFPPELKKWQPDDQLWMTFGCTTWIVPTNLKQLQRAWSDNPGARFVAGATALGKLVKEYEEENLCFISCHGVEELQNISLSHMGIDVGAAATFTMMEDFFKTSKQSITETGKLFILQAFLDCIRWLAVDQIRNVATIGGYVACRALNLDMIALLIAMDATVNLMDSTGTCHNMKLENYLSDDQNAKELVLKVHIPFNNKYQYVSFQKHPQRRGDGFNGVSAAMTVDNETDDSMGHFTACFGGLTRNTVKIDTPSDLFKSLSFEKLEGVLRNRLSEEKGEVKEELLVVSLGFIRKFQDLVNEEGSFKELPGHIDPEPRRFNIVFDDAPAEQPPTDPVWRPIPQTTAEDLVAGQAMFIDDMPSYQNELHLCLVLSNKARAKIVSVDWSGAQSFPGVVDCIDHTAIPETNKWGLMACDEEMFASSEVVYYGQPVGAVIAKSPEQAASAAEKVKIEYDEMKPILTIEDAIRSDSFIDTTISRVRGEASKTFPDCDKTLEGTICTGAQEHFYMETIGAICIPKKEQNEIEIFVTHQGPTFIQSSIATCLQIPCNRVIVRHKRTGGAFGGKETQPVKICVPVALAAHRNNCPVRGVLTRKQDLAITGKRHPYQFHYKVGFNKDCRIQCLDVKVYSDAGCSRDTSPEVMNCTVDYIEGCCAIPNVTIEGRICRTNTVSNGSFRGFGIPQGCVAMETVIDHIAHTLNVSSKHIQEMNFAKTGFVPFTKLPIEDETMLKSWAQCQKQANYSQKDADVMAFNEKYKQKKRGLAMMPLRFQIGFPAPLLNQGNALVHVYLDGSVSLSHGGCEIGQGLNMKLLQIASRALGVPLSKIYTSENSTQTIANAVITMGSSTTDVIGTAVLNACTELLSRLQPVKERKPNASWEEIIRDAYFNRISLSVMAHGRPGDGGIFYYTYGAACSVVEVDCLTGEHQVLSTDIVMDVGRSLNPGIDVGQIEGGFLQGYGMVAFEEWKVKENGESPTSYRIPDVRSLPRDFNVTLLSNCPKKTMVYSSKGIGEPPLLLAVTVHKAIRSAILAARKDMGLTDFIQLDCPVTPTKVLEACHKKVPI